jgi:hypothetical protein
MLITPSKIEERQDETKESFEGRRKPPPGLKFEMILTRDERVCFFIAVQKWTEESGDPTS